MQELHQLIKTRFDQTRKLCEANPSVEDYNKLREEEKVRCEKEGWIFSMFRSKKNLSLGLKKNYFSYSYSIMQIIQPSFRYEEEENLADETFLNEFVCLYTRFFDQYENKFNFKMKVRNLLRPTNHNVIHDLIKYLVDFSRDYSQHLYFWRLKNSRKITTETSFHNSQSQLDAVPPQNTYTTHKIQSKEKPSSSLKKCSYSEAIYENRRRDEAEPEVPLKKKQKEFNRLYGILQIQAQSTFILSEKSKANIDMLKLKFNQIYRDAKWRNNLIKKSISDYYACSSNKQMAFEEQEEYCSFPLRISLSVQKNGFSCLNVGHQSEPRACSTKEVRELLPGRQKLQNIGQVSSNRNIRASSDFMLNSLKILRVSQNFLPPIIAPISTKNPEQSGRKEEYSSLRKQSNFQNHINIQIQSDKEPRKDGMVYYNQELAREAQRKKNQKKRISDIRRHFVSEQKMKQTRKRMNQPEDKIVEWLDKINLMKQLERKKIMGLG